MEDDILIKIAKDLTKTVKENMCPAWHERKQAQAKMRMHIKKLLKNMIIHQIRVKRLLKM